MSSITDRGDATIPEVLNHLQAILNALSSIEYNSGDDCQQYVQEDYDLIRGRVALIKAALEKHLPAGG